MKILHNIHERNGNKFEGNVGTIDYFDGESYQIYEKSKQNTAIIFFPQVFLVKILSKKTILLLAVRIY